VRTQSLIVALGFAAAVGSAAVVRAQDKPPAREPVVTPLRIQVVISRYQGEKRISSLPYTLSLSVTDPGDPARRTPSRSNLRMGTKIPVNMMTVTQPSVDGKPMTGVPMVGQIQYQDVGTNIDCTVWPHADGRYGVDITVDDSSVYPDEKDTPGAAKGSPSFRSFRATDSMILKDGGTGQFTTATDKVTGELVKVDVTLTVVK